VLGGTCRIISYVHEPGVIRHLGIEPVVAFGELSGGVSPRTADLESALDLGAAVKATASGDIVAEIWKKFLFFAPVSGVGSVARAPIGVLRAQPETHRLLASAVREVHAVALAAGVDLPSGSVEDTLAFIDSIPAAGTSSLQRDFEDGRRTELEALAGAVRRIGERYRVPTPVHDFVYAALLPLERRAHGAVEW
jgi:2-dehydropantoate 2-reductase